MRFTVLALLLLASESHADRGHQAYENMLQDSARAHEQWINKPCTPRGRFLANIRQRLGTTTVWSARLYTTGHWRITFLGIVQQGCDASRRRHVHVYWH